MLSEQSNKEFKDAEFSVIQEPWNTFILTDFGVKIRQKFIVTRILTKDLGEGFDFRFSKQVLTESFNFPDHIYSAPTEPVPINELRNRVVKPDIDFKSDGEDWNIYEFETSQGLFRFRVKNTVVSVSETNVIKPSGEPIYLIDFSEQMVVQPKK